MSGVTKQKIHEALCELPDQEKMTLAVECQLNGISVESLEELIANAVNYAQAAIEPSLKNYEYLRGGTYETNKETHQST